MTLLDTSVSHPAAPIPLLDAATRSDVRVRTVSTRRRLTNRLIHVGLLTTVGLAVIPLVTVMVVLLLKGGHLLNAKFFTSDIPAVTGQSVDACKGISEAFRAKYGLNCAPPQLGVGPAILGTLLSTGLASLIAIPLGIMGAVYVHEIGGNNRSARLIRFLSDVMTGVPSIVMGMFIYIVWVVRFGTAGRSAFAAGLALAAVMLPIVVRSSEEMLKLVPDDLRNASYALGGRRWQGVLRVVLPAALPGLTSGALLGVARAAGETAPVLFTIGVTLHPNFSLFGNNTSLAQQIYTGAKSGIPMANDLAWGSALTLVLLVFALTAIARLVSSRFATDQGS